MTTTTDISEMNPEQNSSTDSELKSCSEAAMMSGSLGFIVGVIATLVVSMLAFSLILYKCKGKKGRCVSL